ncbi:minor tail protein [Arthrobacter phage vB_ArS-ArV2]|uniref:Minor tail protein n=1 Tax=Arthrobacter phage vB_ArS-ArV2 TaxID=1414742 RepID=V5RBD3_9CAUD|nr:minor tail protein [Arthrobacter phage vB_ArS-ArV2]AHB31629.1 minor tail protein [Arthrobacter phage vB_ArS-ArV2]
MAVAVTKSVYYDGPVTETDRAQNRTGAPDYGVYGPNDFKVTPHPTIANAVIVKAGKAHGHGVTDILDSDAVVNCAPLAVGQARWDLIVVRRNWQPNLGGPSTLEVLQAGGVADIPEQRKVGPGVEDDQPLFFVKWQGGTSAPVELIDVRVWTGNGGLYAKSDLVRTYMGKPGTEININGVVWACRLGVNDVSTWERSPGARVYSATAWQNGAIPVSTSPDGRSIRLAEINIPDPGFPYHVQVLARFEGGKSTTRWDANVSLSGQSSYTAVAALGNVVAPWYDISGFTSEVITGPSRADLNLFRFSGTESFGLTQFNRTFRVMVVPAGS